MDSSRSNRIVIALTNLITSYQNLMLINYNLIILINLAIIIIIILILRQFLKWFTFFINLID